MLFVIKFVVAPGLANDALKPGPGVPPVQLTPSAQNISLVPPAPDQTPLPRMPPVVPVTKFHELVMLTPPLSVKMSTTELVKLDGKLFVGVQVTVTPAALLLITSRLVTFVL